MTAHVTGTRQDDHDAARSVTDWLCLVAAPIFLIMALLTAFADDATMICSTAHETLPINGMTIMYLLMSVFHSAPWIRLIAHRRSGTARS
ncbi:hypothetical protein [Phyllobacterium sp. OV277]|jgi:cytochrome bd-type quinol oxidase subunit 2|uniref:hypothetical protein n=1 Tax=Phyllobacterium sp. OV277 TaxID=1882772 RepID=UPI00088DE0E1|nr:hypothetical protein [Phyllobacterium sp. OV277]SDP28865.1 hypothetical protein SAMN05443582_104106 [Phyllobacterium sp. OV277]